jgi:hypothetical protein
MLNKGSEHGAVQRRQLQQTRVQTLQLRLRQRVEIHTPTLRLPASALQPTQNDLRRTRIGDRPLTQTTLDLRVTRRLTDTAGCAA